MRFEDFSKTQVQDEETNQYSSGSTDNLQDTICRLEDHHLLQGCVSIFKLSAGPE